MKYILFLSGFSITVTAQASRRIVDFDLDLKKDTISINSDVRTPGSLSTQQCKKIV